MNVPEVHGTFLKELLGKVAIPYLHYLFNFSKNFEEPRSHIKLVMNGLESHLV